MSQADVHDAAHAPHRSGAIIRGLNALGRPVVNGIAYIGGLATLLSQTGGWIYRSMILRQVRVGRPAIYSQMVRLGVRSVGVICLVSACIGLILAFQMAPPLAEYGQTEKVANIVGIAVFRELGPLISAIVLTGFAGASVAAEIGTMVVGEEVEALQAHALNPIRFLVVPRVLATIVALLVLCVLGDMVAVISGWITGVMVLDIPSKVYISNTIEQLDLADFLTGLWKAGVFGGIIGGIACYNGLKVEGGAAGVGRATTNTVVHSIVSIIFTDMLFTIVFYKLGWT
ncbi:MAG: ABC transporter permease [Phycisphaeraceae bacterium]|nr:ABC transporter permease [Phycisphaeraceae bacterium]